MGDQTRNRQQKRFMLCVIFRKHVIIDAKRTFLHKRASMMWRSRWDRLVQANAGSSIANVEEAYWLGSLAWSAPIGRNRLDTRAVDGRSRRLYQLQRLLPSVVRTS